MSENPENELQDANENPWYVLATVFGEQMGGKPDTVLARKNRSVWNAWALSNLNDEQKQEFYSELPAEFDQSGIMAVDEVEGWRELVEAAFKDRMEKFGPVPEVPDPTDKVDLGHTKYERTLELSGYIFASDFYMIRAELPVPFSAVYSVFSSRCFFSETRFDFALNLDCALFQNGCDLIGTSALVLLARKSIFWNAFPKVAASTSFGSVQLTADENRWPSFTTLKLYGGTKSCCVGWRRLVAEHHDTDFEHFFYRQEMRCIIAENGDNFWKRLPYQAFRVFSDFGHSIARPVQWLAGLWGVMTFIYALGFLCGERPEAYKVGTAIERLELFGFSAAYSASNTFAFLGFRGLYLEEIVRKMPGWIQIASAAQTMASFALLFFLALALRNRFRLQ